MKVGVRRSMEENWRDIQFTGGQYRVSDRGRVWSKGFEKPRAGGGTFRRKPGILKQADGSEGYPRVSLAVPGEGIKNYQVSRLVCEAFHGPAPEGKPFVLHGDGNPLNNFKDNLRWGSPADNMQDRINHGNNPERNKTHCPQGHPYDAENTIFYGPKKHRLCRECRLLRGRALRKAGLPPGDDRHGTANGYSVYGCRCEECRDADREWRKENIPSRAGKRQTCEICGASVSYGNLKRHKSSRSCKV